MQYRYILALDPSGNFNEGKGTTGWCLFNAVNNTISKIGSISASDYKCMEAYWNQHLILIKDYIKKYNNELIIVFEDYILYESKMKSQIHSRMETPKIIGIMQWYCYTHNIPYAMQMASEVKNRWSDKILLHKKYIIEKGNKFYLPNNMPLNKHNKDAVRHAIHYNVFRNGGLKFAKTDNKC